MKIKKGFVIRCVGGENIVVPVGEQSKRFQGMITLNDSGAFLWRIFTDDTTETEAVKSLMAEYSIDEETATRGVGKFIQTLKANNFLEN